MRRPLVDMRSRLRENDEKVSLRNQRVTLDSQKRAVNLFLHFADIARKVCMSAGKDSVGNAGGVALIVRIFR